MNSTRLLLLHLQASGFDEPTLEHRFHPERKWRFDVAWPEEKIAVEIDGGSWVHGRHTTGSGFEKDLEKVNAATELGWKVYRFTPRMIQSGYAVNLLKRVCRISPPVVRDEG